MVDTWDGDFRPRWMVYTHEGSVIFTLYGPGLGVRSEMLPFSWHLHELRELQ